MPETMEEDNQAPQRAVFIRVDIPSFNIQKSNNEEVVMYNIECTYKDVQWSVTKRYSECRKLNEELTIAAKNEGSIRCPDFPAKLLFGNLDAKKVEKRRVGLKEWLGAWAYYASTNTMKSVEQLVYHFLDVEHHNVFNRD